MPLLSCILAAALSFGDTDAAFALSNATALVTACPRRDAGTPDGRRAAAWIAAAARRSGGSVSIDSFPTEMPWGRRTLANVECAFEVSPTNGWIVLVSHYDTKARIDCPGANDGASTSGLLLALARSFGRSRERLPMNVLLLWTDGEECFEEYRSGNGFDDPREDGLWGSRHAAAKLKRLRANVRAVIVLDMLGDRNLDMVVARNGTPGLRELVFAAAESVGLGARVSLGPGVIDDHVPFLEAGFPAVDLIDFEYGSAPGKNDWWHTPADTPDKLSAASLFAVGRLVMAFVRFSRQPHDISMSSAR